MARPLVPEDLSDTAQRRSLVRAITAQALGTLQRTSPVAVLSRAWPSDTMAERALSLIARGPVSPLRTGDAPALEVQAVRMLRRLAPKSAALQLFESVMSIPMTGGIATIKIPNVAVVPPANFIAEGSPAPLVKFPMDSTTLGPVKKIVILSAVTRELETASPESASEIIGRLLAASAAKGIDSVALGSAAESDAQPTGLLYGITPSPPTAGGGSDAMTADLANLAGAIADAGLDASSMIIAAAPRQATVLALTAGPRFAFPILSTAALPAGTIAAFAPDAIAAAVEGAPAVETSKHVALHYEDTAPLPIASTGTPNVIAAPVRSAFQEDLLVIKCTARLTWAVAAPDGVQVINSTTW